MRSGRSHVRLAVAVGEVQRFVADTRDKTTEQVQRLANATQSAGRPPDGRRRTSCMSRRRHLPTPTTFSTRICPADSGHFVLNNFSNPVAFICSAIGGIENVTATETGKLCAQYLGPALRRLNFNYLPQPPLNPYLIPP